MNGICGWINNILVGKMYYTGIGLLHFVIFSIIRRLQVTRENTVSSSIDVVENVFATGEYRWGRIVIVYALDGWTVRYCCCNRACDVLYASKVSNCDPESVRQMTACIGDYLARRLWIWKHGGWMCAVKFYFEMILEKALWKELLYGFVCVRTLCVASVVRPCYAYN